MSRIDMKNFHQPDEVRELPQTRIEVINFNSAVVMRATFAPGWKWSECVKPSAGTDSCQVAHVVYVLSGRMVIVMDDGAKEEVAAGDMAEIPPGHDAWVVGDEECVMLDFTGGESYGK
ncbi:MAG: cupin domain-containing protein [Gammaproteobacteria bacterium]|nr:cupin domain-containing protein [Gammaproteobacteria bacterium]